MRVLLAGGSGTLGRWLVPRLASVGYEVVATTRTAAKLADLARLGAEAVVLDVFDADAVASELLRVRPDVLLHQVTDLPDDRGELPAFAARNARVRREGTRHLLAAARAARVARVVAQSVAWSLPGEGGAAVADLEEQVLAFGGVVVRYGQLYGPDTFYPGPELPEPPRVHVDTAARRTVPMLERATGTVTVVEPAPA